MKNVRVGITMGDPAGIGPEVINKALKKTYQSSSYKIEFTVIGDQWIFEQSGGSVLTASFIDLKAVRRSRFRFGRVSADCGLASIKYLDEALSLIDRDLIDCIVTGPISKEAIQLAGYRYSGHTEYFAEKRARPSVVMIMMNRRIKIALLTRHIPLKNVCANLKTNNIVKTITATETGLKSLFGISSPTLVLCALNPHASDNGLIGNEENDLFKPLVKKLTRKGTRISGPIPADIALRDAAEGKYDACIACYHDQALIPLKLMDLPGVNLTAGLDFVRTSPAHGTAFDIAGRGIASPDSMEEAIRVAAQCTVRLKESMKC